MQKMWFRYLDYTDFMVSTGGMKKTYMFSYVLYF